MSGLSINASVRGNYIGMPNLLVTSNWSVADSEITDPFLGIKRRFANFGRGRWTLSSATIFPNGILTGEEAGAIVRS